MKKEVFTKKKNFWTAFIGILICLITVAFIGITYIGMKKDKDVVEELDKSKETEVNVSKEEEWVSDDNTIFSSDWDRFKNQWYNSLNGSERNLGNIIEVEEKPSFFGTRYNGRIGNALFVSADTHKDTKKVVYAVVIGAVKKNDVNRNTAVLIAAANLINLTDQSLTTEEREEIILEHLGLGDGIIVKEKSRSYSHNGILYKAEYEQENGSLATLTVSAEPKNY